ncbi:myb/SANT-like DNA-binding domain-containing protein 3 [Portunus trituberculatus]|uniref:Myb/SANT-like DNA-binding domain-containing protein 3 n=1 Tax=Portunus trituberculatus TaxID=210409 RepID=A0A5B7HPF9_PORTR|nr:myb/SANT-like DNA-binding domain-containing protein 3 [Portunus trituberculatus]XP_045118974.1 myb/SANT-like DNA-binding domain-containing protein 3 [Portunus trituberculatus]XP_045118975.1 myb/SANT-like DNA-binding domain-containing protein 3 [Portunus trituberculatus]XP_045118977.1 myb/SANT-like DNA-binding domain-containing protein 3 [Portunus trituberculatus]XP_045118978.1 myb/SANT-like DNA-binding domain-containing protein 3 [Portunus trituberculatus]XP_045118979.1 myb/SANT-like DNA-bi
MLEGVGMPLVYSAGGAGGREQRRPMWTQHEKAVLRLLMRQYAGVTEFDPPDVHKHPIRNEMWRLLTARYNAHPHVRSRDTKQLRKAWENLKYRARKLGSESQRSGRQQNAAAESSWPLDGVTLPGAAPSTPASPPREAGEVGDWKDADEESQRILDDEEDVEKVVKEEVEEDSLATQDRSSHTPPASERGPTVLSLHPLVSSLLGGGLGSLATTLPFLTSPSSPLATGLLLPQVVSSLSGRELDSRSTILRSSIDAASSPTAVTSAAPTSTTTTSDTSISTSGASVVLNGVSQAFSNTSTDAASPSSPCPEKQPGESVTEPPLAQERLHQRVAGVEASIRNTEEQHQAQMQLLRLQMAQAVTEHDAKMRVLATQLEYWQRRLRVQQQVSDVLSVTTQQEPEAEDEQLP